MPDDPAHSTSQKLNQSIVSFSSSCLIKGTGKKKKRPGYVRCTGRSACRLVFFPVSSYLYGTQFWQSDFQPNNSFAISAAYALHSTPPNLLISSWKQGRDRRRRHALGADDGRAPCRHCKSCVPRAPPKKRQQVRARRAASRSHAVPSQRNQRTGRGLRAGLDVSIQNCVLGCASASAPTRWPKPVVLRSSYWIFGLRSRLKDLFWWWTLRPGPWSFAARPGGQRFLGAEVRGGRGRTTLHFFFLFLFFSQRRV